MIRTTKTTDQKGRVALGKAFASRQVIIEKISETEVRISLARVIPEREMWLWENPKARDSVLLGLQEAESHSFADAPDIAECEGELENVKE